MMYLSRGVFVPEMKNGPELVARCGRTYALGPELATLWHKGQYAPCPVPRGRDRAVRRLEEKGLVSVTEESGPLAAYRLLAGCVICPNGRRATDRFLPTRVKRVWTWIHSAGLRLTASELIRLEERWAIPSVEFLGEEGRQPLTEMIYTADTIQDGILETLMEHSTARDDTVAALLRLLRSGRLLLI